MGPSKPSSSKPKSSASKVDKGKDKADVLSTPASSSKPDKKNKKRKTDEAAPAVAPTTKKAKPAVQPAPPPEEIDFPRGGGTSLTAIEFAEARREGAKEAEGILLAEAEEANGEDEKALRKKRKLADRKEKRGGVPGAGKDHKRKEGHVKDALRVEHLNYKRLVVGTKVAGMVVAVRALEVIVSLPNQLMGHVPITEVSEWYTKRLEEDEDSEEEESGDETDEGKVKRLDEMFTVGQWVRCIVVSTDATTGKASGAFSRLPPLLRSAMRISLSISPTLLNATIPRNDLTTGFVLSAAVKSCEDRGYILNLGVSVSPNASSSSKKKAATVESFVSFVDAVKSGSAGEDGKGWEIGQVVPVKIVKSSDNQRTCTVSVFSKDVSAAQLTAATNIGSPSPLHLVSCLITAVIPGAGLNVKFLGFYDGTIDLFHLDLAGSDQTLEEKYKVGAKLKARILWDTVAATADLSAIASGKQFALSALPHVIRMAEDGAPGVGASSEAARFPVGYTFESVRVERVAGDWGLVCRCLRGESGETLNTDEVVMAFVHISVVADDHVPSLSSASGPFRPLTTHRARVISTSPFDGLLQLSLQPSVLAKNFMSVKDVRVGDVLEGKVKNLVVGKGVFLDVGGGVDGVVWPVHWGEGKLKHPERKFKPGTTVKARVFSVDPSQNRVSLTLKKSLLLSDSEVFSGFADVKVGMFTHGVVTKIMDKGMLVDLFGGIRGLVPIGEAAEAFTDKLDKLFTIGQVVKVKIIRVDSTDLKILASVRKALLPIVNGVPAPEESEPTGSVEIGASVSATITDLHIDNAVLLLQPGDAKGLISLKVLAKNRSVTVDDLRLKLKKGDVILDLVVTKKNEDRGIAIVGFPPRTNTLSKATGISATLSIDALVEGQVLEGKVLQKISAGVIIQISRNLRGRVAWTDLNDDYDQVGQGYPEKNAMVPCVVVGLDVELGRIDLATRASLVSPKSKATVRDRYVESIATLKAGDKIRGIVKNVSDSGLFVALSQNVTARVQIKDLFDDYVKDWKPRFKTGQAVSGTVVAVDEASGKLDLTLRTRDGVKVQKSKAVLEDFSVGQVVDTEVKRPAVFGVFLQIEKTNISGLCHKSQVLDQGDGRDWKERVQEGMKLKAIVIEVDLEKRKIGFSVMPEKLAEAGVVDEASDGEVDDDVLMAGSGDDSDDLEVDVGGGEDDSDAVDSDDGDDSDDDVEQGVAEDDEMMEEAAPANKKPTLTLPNSGFSWNGALSLDAPSDVEHSNSDSDGSADLASATNRPSKKRRIAPAQPASASAPSEPTSATDIEKLLLGSPTSSFLWLKLMAFHLQSSSLATARSIARRALATIPVREEGERFNVWIGWMNLENSFGTEEETEKVFKEACGACEAVEVWLKMGEIYDASGKTAKADDLYARLVKKFSHSSTAWTSAGAYALTHDQPDQARELLQRSLKSLPQRKHIKTVSKFAQLEFKLGSAERGRTLFEGLIASFRKRTDLWGIYVDMEVAYGGGGGESATREGKERVRALWGRALDAGLNSKKSKSIFKKWLAYEERHGDEAGQDEVKRRAVEYVQELMAKGEGNEGADDDEDAEA